MKDRRFENEQLEDLLRRAHLPAASAELKQRVTAEARRTLKQTSGEVSWRIPIRRLTAAAAAAALIVGLADYFSDRAVDRWRSGESFAVELLPGEFETLPEIAYGPFARHLATVSRKASEISASALRDHIETVHRAVDESQQDRTPVSPAPAGGSSRLVPGRRRAGAYS
ncbi:MAG: hypothetical protein ACYSWQ_09635 [Planctomycetota bacterium]|jgi:hypothetical protein